MSTRPRGNRTVGRMRNKAIRYREDQLGSRLGQGYLPSDLFELMQRAGERGWSIMLKYNPASRMFLCSAHRPECLNVCESSNAWSAISQVFTEFIIPREAEHAK